MKNCKITVMNVCAQKLDPKMREERVPFMHYFSDACERFGFKMLSRTFITNRIQKEWRKFLTPLLRLKKKNHDYLVVPCNGDDILESVYPYYNYNIIPMIWDVWPYTWKKMIIDLKKLQPPIVFVTVRSVANKIQEELGILTCWMPEGIAPNVCDKGSKLINRSIDVFEMGRVYEKYHRVIDEMIRRKVVLEYRGNIYNEKGRLVQKAYANTHDFYVAMSNSKIITCFPQGITNPKRSGGLETLTQRYWEAMLSRAIIVGKAPAELIDFIGYNPVIEVDWNNPEAQLETILNTLDSYQSLVDANYETACNQAYWDYRMELLMKKIALISTL